MMYTDFDEYTFRKKVDDALVKVQSILGTTKNPRLAEEDHQHTYDDKFALAEFVSNTSLAAQLTVLEEMGLTSDKLKTVTEWVQKEKQTVTLSFQAKDGCSFLEEQVVDVVTSEGEIETSASSDVLGVSFGNRTEKIKHKIAQKIKEYHWSVQVSWSLFVYRGNDKATAIQLKSRETSTVIVTSGGQATTFFKSKPIPPIAESTAHPIVEAPITWIIQLLDPVSTLPQFSIDRSAADCKTPRRNGPVNNFDTCSRSMSRWLKKVATFFIDRVEGEILDKQNSIKVLDLDTFKVGTRCILVGLPSKRFGHILVTVKEYLVFEDRYRVEAVQASEFLELTVQRAHLKVDSPIQAPSLRDISSKGVFIPVLPLMEKGTILDLPDTSRLLEDHRNSLRKTLGRLFPPRKSPQLVSKTEGSIVLLCWHWEELFWYTGQGINYIERMLRQQLVEAIGEEVHAQDFETFMHFHNQKLFSPEFAPKPFTYAIRRPNHYPDGILAIETASSSQEQNHSIETMVCCVPGSGTPSLFIPINAATFIEMTGDRYLHGWMQHRFESKTSSAPDFNLVARARQFSSFLLIVGTMAGPNKFDPKAAIILQNKDEVIIPLLSNVLPTAREFKDAISSLSPEQQTFCKAFRAMQLESSVFGVCVIQLKPQLEKLLGLAEGGLTKEIQLTQDLMSLFVDYQVPSDLLSYDGDETADNSTKLAAVKGHVKAVMDVIKAQKQRQLVEEERKSDMRDHFNTKKERQLEERKSNPREEMLRDRVSEVQRSLESNIERMLKETVKAEGLAQISNQLNEQASMFKKKSLKQEVRFGVIGAAKNMILSSVGSPLGTRQMPTAFSEPTESLEKMSGVPSQLRAIASEELIHQCEAINEGARENESMVGDGFVPTDDIRREKAIGISSEIKMSSTVEDFTIVPKLLDAKFSELDADNALRSTILSTGPMWNRRRQKNLLVSHSVSSLNKDDIDREKNNAFDLLDALSRSGSLPIACAELHVVIAVSHCFENDVMGTVIQDNVNPIEKVEKSQLMMGSIIYGQGSEALLATDSDVRRLTTSFPELFIED